MEFIYNIPILKALEMYYDGEKCGEAEGLLDAVEKKLGYPLPQLLRDFVRDYGYMSINRGEILVLHPLDMRLMSLDGEDYIVFGKVSGGYAAIKAKDNSSDPKILVGTVNDEEHSVVWNQYIITLSFVLFEMFRTNLYDDCKCSDVRGAEDAAAAMELYGIDARKFTPFDGKTYYAICGDGKIFAMVSYSSVGEIDRLFALMKGDNWDLSGQRFAALKTEDVNGLLSNCFYSADPDYEHALMLNNEMIRREELNGSGKYVIIEQKKISARSLWALGRTGEAEKLYTEMIDSVLDDTSDKGQKTLISVLKAATNFFLDIGKTTEYEKYTAMLSGLCEKTQDYDTIGAMYWAQAQQIDHDLIRIDEAIELYEKAIEAFKKAPKPNKHDIARCQQLRGEARRRKKDSARNNN